MNKTNVQKLIKHLKTLADPAGKPELGFNMSLHRCLVGPSFPDMSGHDCETAACIEGHIRGIAKVTSGAEWLGMTEEEADPLFYPSEMNDRNITVQEAIEVLQELLDTGKVRWTSVAAVKENAVAKTA
jgi:hypothetical protein